MFRISSFGFRISSWIGILVVVGSGGLAIAGGQPARTVVCLDGTWQIAEGCLEAPPKEYRHTVPIPGLADMATPRFESPGSTVSADDRGKPWLRPADPRREAFWYRRTFTLDGPLPPVAKLKVHKARYGTKVFLNGKALGEHGPNFTPGWFDARPHLKGDGGQNELVIRVGASLAQVPPYLTDAWDNEKSRYLPGIYDSVELILCGTPHIVNIQTVPDVEKKAVRAVIELGATATGPVKAIVHDSKSGRAVGETTVDAPAAAKVEVRVPIRDARLWTPEEPFLYELVVQTPGDTAKTRFGLRSFTTDPASGRALLNGRPYFLRGSNVCIYRFFEDAARDRLPWNRDWVRKLHRRFKEMHWNSLRYCIGFPPELWYEIADEEGMLIQDEFPIWYSRAKGGWPEEITPQHLAVEFTEWMRERWNHPCVVIWDAQNETANDHVIAAAMGAVRDLDLSQRPWDNGWGTPQRPIDICEAHPYRSGRGTTERLGEESGIPDNGPKKPGAARPPYLINEYGWLWINRDGSLPTLTVNVYKRLLGENASVAERFEYYARTLAAKTELWRHRRKCAGVLHFCGLGYSRPDGQTSDNFSDVRELAFERNFFQYVRDSFAPVGVMLDFWKLHLPPGKQLELPVSVINDLYDPQPGQVRLRILRGDRVLLEETRPVNVAALGQEVLKFAWTAPKDEGPCRLEASLILGEQKIRSLRDVTIAVPKPPPPVKASSELTNNLGFFPATYAVDGNPKTRWSSEFSDDQWLAVDLGKPQKVGQVEIEWEGAYGKQYAIEVSADGQHWKEVFRQASGKGGFELLTFPSVETRWVRLRGIERGTRYGYSIWEFRCRPGR